MLTWIKQTKRFFLILLLLAISLMALLGVCRCDENHCSCPVAVVQTTCGEHQHGACGGCEDDSVPQSEQEKQEHHCDHSTDPMVKSNPWTELPTCPVVMIDLEISPLLCTFSKRDAFARYHFAPLILAQWIASYRPMLI